jgi:formamidopyrimidine-DNA glycosylase
MADELDGRKIAGVEARQAKCLNVPVEDFARLLTGKTIGRADSLGKWLFIPLDSDALFLLNLGMGAEVLLNPAGSALPEKYQVRLDFQDGNCLTIAFWWFGYAHVVPTAERSAHAMTARLGLDPLNDTEFTFDAFSTLLTSRKCGIKSLLMDQKNVAGIGNVYIQDILFRAGLHPNRKTSEISEEECRVLHRVIVENLRAAVELGGFAYERDLHGVEGRFKDFLVGYREGLPCPTCGTAITKIKTAGTSSFICTKCQVLTSPM